MPKNKYWIVLIFICAPLFLHSFFESTSTLPAAHKGRVRSLEAAAQLYLSDEHIESQDRPALDTLWTDHFLKENKTINHEIYAAVEELKQFHSSPKNIAQALQSDHPLAKRLNSAGSTLKMLPSALHSDTWVSLKALKLSVYDPERGGFIPSPNFTAFTDEQFEQIRSAYLDLESIVLDATPSDQTTQAAQLFARQFLNAYQKFNTSSGPPYFAPSIWRLKLETFYSRAPLVTGALCCYALALLLFCGYRQINTLQTLLAIGLISSKGSAERGKARPKRSGLNEEGMADAMSDEEDRPGEAAAGRTLDEIKPIATLLLLTGYLLHTSVLLLRMLILQRPPVASMFETVLYVPWAAMSIALLMHFFTSAKTAIMASACVACALLMLFKIAYPGAAQLESVQAVLDSRYWLAVHVLMVVASYGAFALAGILGHYFLIRHAFSKGQKTHHNLAQTILQSMYVGIALLIPGTLLGGVWAAESWGRFWDWDPKESWAFISAAVYLLIVHAYRFRQIGDFGLAIGSIWGLMAISFTWYGVNYILGTGFHSYGFGNGGESYYFLYLCAEAFFTFIAACAYYGVLSKIHFRSTKH
jgi:ABC-type transport system involved in cytochrome c biogenesis permease subunit